MFSIANKQLYIGGLYDIVDNFCGLLNDGDNDLLYTGTNKFSSKILGSILFEDDENFFLRYIHTLISDEILFDFLNKKITLREIILNCNSVFIVDKNYNNEIIESALIPIADLPNDFIPLENSFCPSFAKRNTLDYTFSLKGGLADLHKAEPLIMSSTNNKVYSLLNSATTFLQELNITPKIYSEVALAGSFKLNFEIELNETSNLFTKPSDDIKKFIYNFLKYIFDKLPSEPTNALKNTENSTEDFKILFSELKSIYNNRDIAVTEESSEQKAIDLITYSVDAIKDLEYKGYDRIEVSNKSKNGETVPVALIKTDYYNSVADKIFKPEEKVKPDIIIFDDALKDYKIQVYSLNKETGNGGAYYLQNDGVLKISLHLRGKNDYHGTLFTKSLDENLSIDIKGIGKWVNNVLREITIDL
jgi:hypothetical protein